MSIAPMTGTLPNGAAQYHQILADFVSMDAANKGVIYSRLLSAHSGFHNCFEQFTSGADPRSDLVGGVPAIFASKTDLKAGGGQEVKFNVIGAPGGAGSKGSQTLIDRVSKSHLATYAATVAFHRDAISWTKEDIEFLSAGKVLESTNINLLSKKMGANKQNHMAMRLIRGATSYNTYRPNNRTSRAAITAEDTLSLSMALSGRARLSTIGGRPLRMKRAGTGSPIKGYMTFGTDMAFLPLRNDDSFMTAVSNGKANDSLYTGELYDWQGMSWYEFPSCDEKWDDYIGSPFLPKAKIATTAIKYDTNAYLKGNTVSATGPEYFQFFPNSKFAFDGPYVNNGDGENTDAEENYAWIITPAGKVGFVSYLGTGFADNNNTLLLNQILSTNTTAAGGAGTCATARTVGNVVARTSASAGYGADFTPTAGETNLPTGWTYTSEFPVDSIVIPANANGVCIGYGFILGAMAGCFAHGRIDKAMIEQIEDFGMVTKKGYEMIFGTCVTKDPFGNPAGYLLVEHAVEHEGYPVPQIIT